MSSRPSSLKTKLKEKKMNNKKTRFLCEAAMIAAIYVVLVVIFQAWSFGPIQFRIAEALTILPYFTPAAIPGLFIGCFISNVIGGAIWADIIFGSVATLIGAIGSYMLRKMKWAVPLPPIIANTLIVPWVLKYGYGLPDAVPYMMLTVGIGEVIVCGIIGMVVLLALNRYKRFIFAMDYTKKEA